MAADKKCRQFRRDARRGRVQTINSRLSPMKPADNLPPRHAHGPEPLLSLKPSAGTIPLVCSKVFFVGQGFEHH